MKKVSVVGIGPGNELYMTPRARLAMEEADLLCGYNAYIDLVRHLFPEKELLSTGMKQEEKRCHAALEAAVSGKTVAVVCSGDPGVYGMAGLIYELAQEYEPVEIEIVPGVSAAMAGAAILGAPLMHDFAVISLSDLLTPWEKIENRLLCAAKGDFSVCLYNPASKTRKEHLKNACKLMRTYRDKDTVCGWVRNIGRDGQEKGILTLEALEDFEADMFTTVFIGNSSTRILGEHMVTPRGYEGKA